MRSGSLFSRLLTVFLAVILVCVGVLFTLSYINLRDNHIENRMNALKTQARDMAYLASRLPNDSLNRVFGKSTTTEQYMYWKALRVYEEYNAYIIIVDRSGAQRTYYNESTLEDNTLDSLPTQEEIAT